MANTKKAQQALYKRAAPKKNAKKAQRKKWREILVFLSIAVVSIAAVISYSFLYEKIRFSLVDQKSIHGVWIEQNVADYATNEITIDSDGINISGGVVATRYHFDGDILEYQTGGTLHRFRMLNEGNTEMMQISEAHYNPIYRLVEKHEEQLR
ncbi:DUF2850 domain-containing protein [uncultured Vibrio sp.]|uniref:DUF2850 domain-containing protein n=1 Tax=uncultured Vibrio sp. TaxID=114054 RepID=UPI00091E1EB3|nr:DUF2850 domain-containing protein [uncultured Vibrio sp.]OIQ25738.1 MAG: hypothetical protein BM561_04890 [Vibrio sp. MedPE-SWchi]